MPLYWTPPKTSSASSESEKGSLWIRYLGSRAIHRQEVFLIPTDTVPKRVDTLKRRGDIAQIWYVPSTSWVWDAHEEYNIERSK